MRPGIHPRQLHSDAPFDIARGRGFVLVGSAGKAHSLKQSTNPVVVAHVGVGSDLERVLQLVCEERQAIP